MMKVAVIGTLISAGLLILAVGGFSNSSEAFAQRQAPQEASLGSDLIAFQTSVGEIQQITIIDPKNRVMSVYHVESNDKNAMKSVRQIRWDLLLDSHNN